MEIIGSLFAIVMFFVCLFVWLLPIFFIASSDQTYGKEKAAWILAVIFITWFAWIFYWLLAPIKKREAHGYRR